MDNGSITWTVSRGRDGKVTKVTQAHIDARTKDILDAAKRMFVRKGVEAATMQEIASEAGLSAGAIYRYFPSKAHLLRAVCGDWIEHDRALFGQSSVSTHSPLEALLHAGRIVWDQMKSEEAREDTILTLETILAAVRDPQELAADRRASWNAAIDIIEGFLRQGQAAGEIDAQLDARAFATLLLACGLGTRLLALELKEDIDTDAVFDVLSTLAAFGPTAPSTGQQD